MTLVDTPPVSSLPESLRRRLPIVMVGMPGSGKTTVGRLLAQRLRVPHVDTDALVEERTGCAVSDIFASEGEEAFRAYEYQAVCEALTHEAVVSLGGGAVITPDVRRALRGHTVVFVDADIDELVSRVSRKDTRPLLRDDPQGVLRRLDAQRRPFFEEVATLKVQSDSSPVGGVVARILDAFTGTRRVIVGGAAPYEVVLGAVDVAHDIRAALHPHTQRLLILHPRGVASYAQDLARRLTDMGYAVTCMEHPDGEAAKTVDVLATGWDMAAEAGLSRHDAIIGIGGGATTDLAGFVAATWLRGIDVIHVPTTVLGMVDAAVGGKTGINTPAGKNLAGAFHPPIAVIEDPSVLASLPQAERVAGLAEVVKCGFIDDGKILDIIDAYAEQLAIPESAYLAEVIARSVAVKARVVTEDLTESGVREFLNYGHTLAHAIEKCENYQWRHGEAVAVGCVFAAELAADRGLLTPQEVAQHRRAFGALGLPTSYSGATLQQLTEVMFSDKKVRAGGLRFVLLDGIGNPTTVPVAVEELAGPAHRIGISQ